MLPLEMPMLAATSRHDLEMLGDPDLVTDLHDWAGVRMIEFHGDHLQLGRPKSDGTVDGSYPPWDYRPELAELVTRAIGLCRMAGVKTALYFHPAHDRASTYGCNVAVLNILRAVKKWGHDGAYLDGADLGYNLDETVLCLTALRRCNPDIEIAAHISYSPVYGYSPVVYGPISSRLQYAVRGEPGEPLNPVPEDVDDPAWKLWYSVDRCYSQYKAPHATAWSTQVLDADGKAHTKDGGGMTQWYDRWCDVWARWRVAPWGGIEPAAKYIVEANKRVASVTTA